VFRVIPPILLIGVSLLAKWVIVRQINVSGLVLWAASTVLQGIAYLAAAWVAYLVCVGIGERMAASSRLGRASIDASLIRVAARVVGIAAVVTTAFIGATDIGLPIYGVIAGLGVGGLALGLAARPTLENLIGGFILYADRPVRVGDFCKFGDKNGTIEEIGLRSTRVRAHDRTLITVPNAEFSNMEIINVSRRDQTLLDTTVGLRYETTDGQMQTILEKIRALLGANPEVVHDTIRVRFQELGAYSLGIGIRAFIKAPSTTGFLEVQEGILFGIRKIIAEARAEIAFPSQTNYISERPGVAGPPPVPAPADGAAASGRGRTRGRRERRAHSS
jgi:MscS family membrane protein